MQNQEKSSNAAHPLDGMQKQFPSELLKKKSDFFSNPVCKCGKVWHIKHGYKNIYIKTSILKIFVCFRETELKIKEDQDG